MGGLACVVVVELLLVVVATARAAASLVAGVVILGYQSVPVWKSVFCCCCCCRSFYLSVVAVFIVAFIVVVAVVAVVSSLYWSVVCNESLCMRRCARECVLFDAIEWEVIEIKRRGVVWWWGAPKMKWSLWKIKPFLIFSFFKWRSALLFSLLWEVKISFIKRTSSLPCKKKIKIMTFRSRIL